MENKEKPKLHPAEGHRGRLRQRFLQGGLDAFLDYEIVELLLTLGTPRSDCKQPAKAAIRKFRGVKGVIDAPVEELVQIKGIGPNNVFGLKLFQAISERYAKFKLSKKNLLDSPELVANFLKKSIGQEKKEFFVILCLDSRNNLIKARRVSMGTLNANLVHPREVFREAIQNNAAQVIVCHNHPSGDTEPSEEDLLITKRLIETGKLIGIDVLDHIIVSKIGFCSLKEKHLM